MTECKLNHEKLPVASISKLFIVGMCLSWDNPVCRIVWMMKTIGPFTPTTNGEDQFNA